MLYVKLGKILPLISFFFFFWGIARFGGKKEKKKLVHISTCSLSDMGGANSMHIWGNSSYTNIYIHME